MKKIPSLFQREEASRGKASLVIDRVTPGCEWALDPRERAIATRKVDGTAVLIRDGVLYARYDAKAGKPAPEGGIPCQDQDPVTGHWPHWVKADRKEDKWIRDAFAAADYGPGTYEAVGPKIQGNPEGMNTHMLVLHGSEPWPAEDRNKLTSFDKVRAFLESHEVEGIVWHHEDGRMCKAKRRDFGLAWPCAIRA